jgi:hypothetical protein
MTKHPPEAPTYAQYPQVSSGYGGAPTKNKAAHKQYSEDVFPDRHAHIRETHEFVRNRCEIPWLADKNSCSKHAMPNPWLETNNAAGSNWLSQNNLVAYPKV